MSQKTSKKSARQHTEEECDASFKAPNTKSDSNNEKPLKGVAVEEITTDQEPVNGDLHTENGNKLDSPKRVIQTRSRSNTPQIKHSLKSTNGVKDSPQPQEDIVEPQKDTETEPQKDPETEPQKDTENEPQPLAENGAEPPAANEPPPPLDNESIEMEPLVLLEKDEEEAILPELQFDENDVDVESEGSPNRCKTRRSQTRNISTPKTPKVEEQEIEIESRKTYSALENLPEEETSGNSTPKKSDYQQDEVNIDLDTSDTFSSVSTENFSTRAMAGGDNTRNIDLTYTDSGSFEENTSTIASAPKNNLSFGETVRSLSSRRTIRPITGDYRRIALRNNLDNKKSNSYVEYESVERISTGLKRKHHTQTPDNSKRFKRDSMLSTSATSGLFSYISSPFLNIKNNFQYKSGNHTPKLIAYETREDGFDDGFEDIERNKLKIGGETDEEKKWCSIM